MRVLFSQTIRCKLRYNNIESSWKMKNYWYISLWKIALLIFIFCYNSFKEGGIDYNSLSKTRPKCIHFFSSDNHYSFCIKRDRAVGHCKTCWHKRRGGKLLTLYIKKKTFALSIVMKISLSSMTMIIAHLPSSRNHYQKKKMKNENTIR